MVQEKDLNSPSTSTEDSNDDDSLEVIQPRDPMRDNRPKPTTAQADELLFQRMKSLFYWPAVMSNFR